jgi:poly-gamma-glutamate synthesis protein (capsule biosynthesis protein)
MHAGVEYNRGVEEETARLFRMAANMGADCVLGSHPHVARKSEIYNTGDRQVLINYSMGNFLSNQNDKYTDIGTMTKLVIRKQGENASLEKFEIIPTYRLRFRDTDGKTKRRIILVADIDNYSHISEGEKQVIREVNYDVTMLLGKEKTKALEVK